MNYLKLLWQQFFGKHSERIDGSMLFSNEYSTSRQCQSFMELYHSPVVRVAFYPDKVAEFSLTCKLLQQAGVQVLVLLDAYCSDTDTYNRINFVRTNLPWIQYFELFNELPQMVYPGQPITTLQMLLDKTTKFTDYIHSVIPKAKVLSMAPYNSIDERTFPSWNNVTNTEILHNLAKYTSADIVAIHLYGNSLSKRLSVFHLMENFSNWGIQKPIWVTETGADNWSDHIDYYRQMIRLFCNIIKPEKILWYRQTILASKYLDAGFALECQSPASYSPLWGELIGDN